MGCRGFDSGLWRCQGKVVAIETASPPFLSPYLAPWWAQGGGVSLAVAPRMCLQLLLFIVSSIYLCVSLFQLHFLSQWTGRDPPPRGEQKGQRKRKGVFLEALVVSAHPSLLPSVAA